MAHIRSPDNLDVRGALCSEARKMVAEDSR
jgi:hypothetical protein